MSADRPSVLVIGTGMYVCGRGTSGFGTILPTLAALQEEGEIGDVWVAGRSPDGLRAFHKQLNALNERSKTLFQIKSFPQSGAGGPLAYREALRKIPHPACAIVSVPDHAHAPITEELIQAGIHVLVVKPFVPTASEAVRLTELAARRGVYGAVEFHKRFDEANLLLRQFVADGKLGELRHVSAAFSQRRSVRKAFEPWIQHTNIFQYLGVHYADLIYFITGARPVRVLATGSPAPNPAWQLDVIQALIEWEVPVTGRRFTSDILTHWIDPESSSAVSDQKICVIGTLGRYESDQKRRGVQWVSQSGATEEINPYFSQLYTAVGGTHPVLHGYGPKSIRLFLDDVRRLLRGECGIEALVSVRPSFQEALVSVVITEAVRRSLDQGMHWVAIEQDWAPLAAARTSGPHVQYK